MPIKIEQSDFIERANILHNYKYSYENFIYVGAKTKSIITCPEHGDFLMTPSKHINGQKCPKCRGLYKDIESLLKKFNEIYNFKYKYPIFYETTNKTKIKIICPIHGEFTKSIYKHLNNQGCKKCSNEIKGKNCRSNTEDFIKKSNEIHNFRYNYEKTIYETATSPVVIICDKHGEFLTSPNSHLSKKSGCPRCLSSKGELEILKILSNNNIKTIQQYKDNRCRNKIPLRFDFAIFIDDLMILIEFQGKQHYKPTIYGNMNESSASIAYIDGIRRDNIKKEFCKIYNIPLLEIKYDQIDNAEYIILNYINELRIKKGIKSLSDLTPNQCHILSRKTKLNQIPIYEKEFIEKKI